MLVGDRVVEVEVDEARRDVPCLSDDEIGAVARPGPPGRAALRLPAGRGVGDRPAACPRARTCVLLQSRPETVWSRKKIAPARPSGDTFTSIVHNLLHPSGTRPWRLH